MNQIRIALARLTGLFNRSGRDRELREELQSHLDMETEDNVRRGMSPHAARRQAIVASGGMTSGEEAVRGQRGVPFVESTTADLRYAWRALRHSPAFTTIAVVTLALGVGANTAIFSVVNGVVLHPLPYPTSDRLVALTSVLRNQSASVSGPDFMDWRRDARSFTGITGGTEGETILTGSGKPARLAQSRVTANAFDVLGIRPVLGRAFLPGEDLPSAARVAMLDERLWRQRFGGDSSIVGKTLLFDELPTLIVGIAPSTMRWPSRSDVWMTTRFTERDLAPAARGARWIEVVARLTPGVSLEAARAEMRGIALRLADVDPKHNGDVGVAVTPLLESMIGDVRKPLFILLGAVAFVLLIACANVGSLMLARIAARDAELAVRTALGASRGRIVRQILTECFLIASIGGMLGLLVALGGVRALVAIGPADLPRLHDIRLDASVLAFTLAASSLTALLFGVVPALHAGTSDLNNRLRASGRGSFGRHSNARSRRALVILEVASAIVLLAGAGLLLRSFARLRDVDPGFRAEGVSTFSVALPSTRYETSAQQLEFTTRLLDGLRRVRGVTAVAPSFALPLSGDRFGFTFTVRGRPPADPRNEPRAQARVAGREYFAAMGIPLIRGRLFDATDRAGAGVQQTLIISAELARRYFPNEDPIGKYIETGWGGRMGWDKNARFGGQVVGIVGDVRQDALDRDRTPHLYMSYDQWPLSDYNIVIRSTAPSAEVLDGARSVLAGLDDQLPLDDAKPLTALVDASLGQRRFYLSLLALFACVALVLALVGIYGLIAYGVQQRRREIGVRLALGATKHRVIQMVLADGLRLVAVGTIIGVTAALMLTRLLEKLLFDVGARDPLTFIAAPAMLLVAAALACILPALGAARLDPVEVIRAN